MQPLRLLPVLLLSLCLPAAFAAPIPRKNPCSLASVADSAAALKTSLKPGMEMDGMCMYNDATGKPRVMISANSIDSTAQAQQAFQYAGKDSVKPVEPIPGIGDEAKVTYSNSGPIILVVRKGTTLLLISILSPTGSDASASRPGLIEIAKVAAGHL